MINQGKHNLLGVLIDSVDYEAAVEKIITATLEKQPFAVSALAVHGVMTGLLNLEQRSRLNYLDLVVPDGQPVRWALNWLYKCGLKDRVYGPTLMLKVCDRAAEMNLPIYLYGSTSEVLEKLSYNLKKKFPSLKIAGTQPSLFQKVTLNEQLTIANCIAESGAAIVFVGLGCPRQETWIYEHKQFLSMPMIAVGAAFDFHAGLLAQAPVWMQNVD